LWLNLTGSSSTFLRSLDLLLLWQLRLSLSLHRSLSLSLPLMQHLLRLSLHWLLLLLSRGLSLTHIGRINTQWLILDLNLLLGLRDRLALGNLGLNRRRVRSRLLRLLRLQLVMGCCCC
jgi:hypothetical protein